MSKISFAKAITIPPKKLMKPLARWPGSWLFRLNPIWTTPKPSRMKPMALIAPNTKSDSLLILSNGSPVVAKTVTDRQKKKRHSERDGQVYPFDGLFSRGVQDGLDFAMFLHIVILLVVWEARLSAGLPGGCIRWLSGMLPRLPYSKNSTSSKPVNGSDISGWR